MELIENFNNNYILLIQEIFKDVENINNLPNMEELKVLIEEKLNKYKIDQSDISELIFIIFGDEIDVKLKDDTIITLIRYDECFSDNNEEGFFYFIPVLDTYICLKCGLWQKKYNDYIEEVSKESPKWKELFDMNSYELKLLPSDWDRKGIKKYFRNGFNYLENKS